MQISAAQYVARVMPDWLFVSIPNGGKRGIVAAVMSKKMGEVPGFPDSMILGPDRRIEFVEFKRPNGGRLSDDQKRIITKVRAMGWPVPVIDNMDDYISFARSLDS